VVCVGWQRLTGSDIRCGGGGVVWVWLNVDVDGGGGGKGGGLRMKGKGRKKAGIAFGRIERRTHRDAVRKNCGAHSTLAQISKAFVIGMPAHFRAQHVIPHYTPALKAATAKKGHHLTSLICQLCTGHCFDANYSDTFRSGANDNTTCPCSHIPRCPNHLPHRRICRHTKEHIIFHCIKTAALHDHLLHGLGSLRIIFQSQDLMSCLCDFLTESESSLFHPLPGLPNVTPEPRPEPWPDPLM